MNISLRVLSRPDENALPTMYRELGTDFVDRVLPSICNEVSEDFYWKKTQLMNLEVNSYQSENKYLDNSYYQ